MRLPHSTLVYSIGLMRVKLRGKAWLASGALAAASFIAAGLIGTPTASAVPAFARQTGQPCATCHTAFPELTPYGRQFKLMGYTSGGTRCYDGSAKSNETQVPFAAMAMPANFTGTKNSANAANFAAAPNISNNSWMPQQFSIFAAGQVYCNVGMFGQVTYDAIGKALTWDNMDIRWTRTGTISGTSIVYGVTANNNPSVQDVWNTAPAWMFPYMDTATGIAGPTYGTMLGTSAWGQQVAGAGAYVWINSSIYAELTAYTSMPKRLLADWNGAYDPTASRIDGAAPYWRFAYEKTWDKNSLMFGTMGMYADQRTAGAFTPIGITDGTLDMGLDAQYQWIGEQHIFTLRTSWIWERKKNSVENALAIGSGAPPAKRYDELNDFNVSASYIYDRTISFTAGYFNTWGTNDPGLYGNAGAGINPGLALPGPSSTANGSPNSSYWKFDLAYLPFMNGGPDLWPWFNARIGIQYTHFDKFDGTRYNIDQSGLKASGNNSVYVYTWLVF